nr:EOG090X0E0D [Eulimnadia texana]
MTDQKVNDNLLGISWHDSAWIRVLNPGNVMDYFMERSNPFYDRTCNNELVKMQRLSMDQLNNMVGIEYILLHVQEPLYVVRKQHRHSQAQVTPITDYYIVAGVIYQAPDLGSVINSRVVTLNSEPLAGAFDEAFSFSGYHPSKGYWWDFKDNEAKEKEEEKKKKKQAKDKFSEEPSSRFQRQRVDLLLSELTRKFPPKIVQNTAPNQPASDVKSMDETPKQEIKTEIKTEPPSNASKPPPEKRARLS